MTAEVIDDDGGFNTGEIGEIDKNSFIKITGNFRIYQDFKPCLKTKNKKQVQKLSPKSLHYKSALTFSKWLKPKL